MDGKTLLDALNSILQESGSSAFIDTKTSYDFIYSAVCEFVRRTNCLQSYQTITTVASQTNYNLNTDFMNLVMKDNQGREYIKINDGSSDNFLYFKEYQAILHENNSNSVNIPSNFSIVDKTTMLDIISGTVTSVGALSNGECTLTDSSAPFTNIVVGDTVHNTVDDSHGFVVSKTSNSALVTALFNGTDNDWDASDTYKVMPQSREQLVLDPPPSTSGYTITVWYAQKPEPVYSLYGRYKLNSRYKNAIVMYAAWLYKYRDDNPNIGDRFYQMFENEVRKASNDKNKQFNKNTFKVNFMKSSHVNRSMR